MRRQVISRTRARCGCKIYHHGKSKTGFCRHTDTTKLVGLHRSTLAAETTQRQGSFLRRPAQSGNTGLDALSKKRPFFLNIGRSVYRGSSSSNGSGPDRCAATRQIIFIFERKDRIGQVADPHRQLLNDSFLRSGRSGKSADLPVYTRSRH